MIKRLFGLAVIIGFIFAMGTAAFADDSKGYTRVSMDVTSTTTIYETSSDQHVATIRLSSDVGGVLTAPTIAITVKGKTDSAGKSFDVKWVVDSGYTMSGTSNDAKFTFKDSDKSSASNSGSENPHYNYIAKLYVSAKDISQGTYNIKVSSKDLASSIDITVKPWAKEAPKFDTTTTTFNVPLGSKDLNASFKVNTQPYYDPSATITISTDAKGEAALKAIGITLSKDGYLSVDAKAGVSYSKDITIKVRATVNKDPRPHAEENYTISITGAKALAVVSPDVSANSDLGKLYNSALYEKAFDKTNNTNATTGLYVGDALSKDSEAYKKYFTFKVAGVLPISVSVDKQHLPDGLKVELSNDVSDDSYGGYGKNGYKIVTISGTPTSKDLKGKATSDTDRSKKYSITITASDDTKTKVTKAFTITTLLYPKPVFSTKYPKNDKYNVPLGATSLDATYSISMDMTPKSYGAPVVSTDFSFTVVKGSKDLKAIGLSLDIHGHLSVDAKAGISYDKDFTFTVRATLSKDTQPYSEKEYTINVKDTVALAIVSPEIVATKSATQDLGKLYGAAFNGSTYNKGIYVGDPLSEDSDAYEEYFTFKIKGVLPISASIKGLPDGLSVDISPDVSDDSYGGNGKNGYKLVRIVGTPTSKDASKTGKTTTATLTYSDKVTSLTKQFNITTLIYPDPEFATASTTKQSIFTFTLGAVSTDANGSYDINLKDYTAPSADITFTADAKSTASLDKIGVTLSPDGTLYVSSTKGVSYDADFKIIVTATVSKDTYPKASKDFTIHVDGGALPALSFDSDVKVTPNNKTKPTQYTYTPDIGQEHDEAVHGDGFKNGLYVGEAISTDNGVYDQYFTFTFKGTLPLHVQNFDSQLPDGLSVVYSYDMPTTDNNGKTGYRTIKIVGTPTAKAVSADATKLYSISFDVSNDIGTVKTVLKMTVLRYPSVKFVSSQNNTFSIKLGTDGEDFDDSYKIMTEDYEAKYPITSKDIIFGLVTGKESFDLIGLSMDRHGKLLVDANNGISYDKDFTFKVGVTVSRDTLPFSSKDFTVKITGAYSPDISADVDLTPADENSAQDLGQLYDTAYHDALYGGNGTYTVAKGLYVGEAISNDSAAGRKFFVFSIKGTLPMEMDLEDLTDKLPDGLTAEFLAENKSDDSNGYNGKNGYTTIKISGTPEDFSRGKTTDTKTIKFDVSNALGKQTVTFKITTLEYPNPKFTDSPMVFNIPLGATSLDETFKIAVEPYTNLAPSSDIIYTVEVGEDELKEIGIVLKPNGQLSVDRAAGVDYHEDFTIKVLATVNVDQDTEPTASKDITISITGAISPDRASGYNRSDYVKDEENIGTYYDKYVTGFSNGFYVGEEISPDFAAEYFTFVFKGTLPMEVDEETLSEQLPEGLTFTISADEPDSSDHNGKNGIKKVMISGTPTEAASGDFTIKVTNPLLGGTSHKFNYTVLPYPTIEQPEDESRDITWGKRASIDIASTGFSDAVTWTISADSKAWLDSLDLTFSYENTTAHINGTWKQGINEVLDFSEGPSAVFPKSFKLIASGSGRTISRDVSLRFILTAPEISFTSSDFVFYWSEDKDGEYSAANSDDLSPAVIKMMSGGTIIRSGFYSTENKFKGSTIPTSSTTTHNDDPGYSEEANYLPAGLSGDALYGTDDDDRTDDYYADYAVVHGKPIRVTALKNYIFWAQNDAGISSAEIPIKVTATHISIDIVSGELVSGNVAINTTYPTVILKAYPGPINWTKANFPDGIDVSPYKNSNDIYSYAYISGTFKSPTGTTKSNKFTPGSITYEIIATNSNDQDLSDAVTADVWVRGAPVISDKVKFSAITVDKIYKSGNLISDPQAQSWDISLAYDDVDFDEDYDTYHPYYTYAEVNNTSQDFKIMSGDKQIFGSGYSDAKDMMNSGRYPVYYSGYEDEQNSYESKVHEDGDYTTAYEQVSDDRKWTGGGINASGDIVEPTKRSGDVILVQRHSYLYVDSNAKTPIVTGSIDRMPKNGKLKIKVIAHYYGVVTSKDFEITVNPASPKLVTKAFTTATAKETSHDWELIATGSKPMKMTAYIAGKDANKLFGTKYPANSSIDITYNNIDKSDNVSFMGEDDNYTLTGNIKETRDNPTGLAFWSDGLTGKGYIKLFRYGNDDDDTTMNAYVSKDVDKRPVSLSVDNGVAFKAIPITIRIDNADTDKKKKPITASIKLNIDPVADPEMWYNANASSEDATVFSFKRVNSASNDLNFTETDGTKISGDYGAVYVGLSKPDGFGNKRPLYLHPKYMFFVKGDNPITVTVSQPLATKQEAGDDDVPAKSLRNGIWVTSFDSSVLEDTDSVLSEVKASDGTFYVIGGTPTEGKETKTKITFTVKNNSTGKSIKKNVTITALQRPTLTATSVKKEFEIGKKINMKGGVKGSKGKNGFTWKFKSATIGRTEVKLSDYNLSVDVKTGALNTGTGVATKATYIEATGKYTSMDVAVVAHNDAGDSTPLHYIVGIKGSKPKVTSKTLTFYRASSDWGMNADAALIKTDANAKSADIKFTITDAKTITALTGTNGIGFPKDITTTGSVNGKFVLTSQPKATKGTSVKFDMENYGTKATGSVKIVVLDPKPEIQPVTIAAKRPSTTAPVNYDKITLTLTDATKATNDSKITWKIKDKPDWKSMTAKLTPIKTDKNLNSAELQLTIKKVKATDTIPTTVKLSVTAATSSFKTNNTYEYPITVSVTPLAGTVDNEEAPEDLEAIETETETNTEAEVETEPETEAEVEEPTGTITFGNARTADNLTYAQKAGIANAGYQIVAVLPEVKADVDGMYTIEDIALGDDAVTGAELKYFPFPVGRALDDEEGSTEFFDDAGEIFTVPASKVVSVSTWLYADKTYTPVIAVKVENAIGAKDKATDLKEGEVLTEDAIKTE